MSSQQGPRIFLPSSKCSRLEVWVPKTWEKVAPFRSDGSWGISACGMRDSTRERFPREQINRYRGVGGVG